MLLRILEPELMDTAEDAHEYDAMDHSIVNAQFVTDLLEVIKDWSLQPSASTVEPRPVIARSPLKILDLGAGTAQIPIELARRAPHVEITAVDAALSMLDTARENITAAGLTDRIKLVLADAKNLPFDSGAFPIVISNSIVHHIGEPLDVIAEAVRVTEPDGLLFHRDLARPNDDDALHHLVDTYAGDATPYQRRLFANSLRAALTADEMGNLVAQFAADPDSVQMTSDRHWTWAATKT
jgi:ubiquinone/menaquinone biosynthesis C-methylase UbiE